MTRMNGTIIGMDTAKRVFQLHAFDTETGEVRERKLSRARLLEHFAGLPPCVVAMEACGGSHHWGRQLGELGHEVRLLPAARVRPFASGNKSDVHDARAGWTAARQPGIRPVPVKSVEQQAVLGMHRARQQLASSARRRSTGCAACWRSSVKRCRRAGPGCGPASPSLLTRSPGRFPRR